MIFWLLFFLVFFWSDTPTNAIAAGESIVTSSPARARFMPSWSQEHGESHMIIDSWTGQMFMVQCSKSWDGNGKVWRVTKCQDPVPITNPINDENCTTPDECATQSW